MATVTYEAVILTTSFGNYEVIKKTTDAQALSTDTYKQAYELFTRTHVTMQVSAYVLFLEFLIFLQLLNGQDDLNRYRALRDRLKEGWQYWRLYDSPSLPNYDQLCSLLLDSSAKVGFF